MLKIIIGHCRKIGEPNYGSRGASVKLELEADTALLADPNAGHPIRAAALSAVEALPTDADAVRLTALARCAG